jgi:hypothetical protein
MPTQMRSLVPGAMRPVEVGEADRLRPTAQLIRQGRQNDGLHDPG